VTLPDFLLIGAPKSGTTALHTALAAHPQLFMSAVKEPKFFLTGEEPPPSRGGGPGDVQTYREHIWRRDDYEALFGAAPPGALCGESTPFYLYDRDAQRRIRRLIPGARLIVVLRDPVERAHSNWTHLWSAGLEPVGDFVRACEAEDRRVAAGWAAFWHYTRLGRYGDQLDHLFTQFAREQVHILRYRELVASPLAALDGICAFLGVQQGLLTEVPRENVTVHPHTSLSHTTVSRLARGAARAGRHLPAGAALTRRLEQLLQRGAGERKPLTWQQRQAVLPYFENDVRLLEKVMEADFGDWLQQSRERSGGMVGSRPSGQTQARNGQARNVIPLHGTGRGGAGRAGAGRGGQDRPPRP
jgi:Sulfotransferase family